MLKSVGAKHGHRRKQGVDSATELLFCIPPLSVGQRVGGGGVEKKKRDLISCIISTLAPTMRSEEEKKNSIEVSRQVAIYHLAFQDSNM